ncbi:MAG: TetR/AcrR family transcriptional regulator [Chthoniobacterales bacterium]
MKRAPIKAVRNIPPSGAREQIVEAGRTHFFRHGFRGVTMDELAAELGMSKKTLYNHFKSKHVLLEAVLAAKFAAIETELDRIGRDHPHDFPAALHHLLAAISREMGEIKPPFVRDMRQKAPQLFKTVERRRAEIIERTFDELFVEGQRTGMVRKDIPAKVMIEILLGAVQAIANPAKMQELSLTPAIAFSSVLKIALEGALTEKGRKI